MKITLRTQEYSDDHRRALWWKYNGSSAKRGNPRRCPMASRDDCRGHLESVGHSEDEDLNFEWSRAIERFEANKVDE